jgi:hypothetical protein
MSVFRPSRPSRKQRYARPALQALETRETPATLMSPTMVTYQDTDGDNVTVRFSKPVLTAANVNTVFHFNVDGVFGNSLAKQQLWEIDLAALGNAAQGTAASVLAARSLVHGGNGMANVGHVDATGIDLGSVVVDGDLGRINVGDANTTTRSLASLTVQSMGRFGTTTQAPGGDLESDIKGATGSITVKSDFNGARISTNNGGHVGTIAIGGSIIGGALVGSGLFSVYGNIGSVTVKGNFIGGTSSSAGEILCLGKIGSLTVGGSLIGGSDVTGGVQSQYGIGTVKIAGDLVGGTGMMSGQIYAWAPGATIGSVTIGGSVIGGTNQLSGSIYSSTNIGPVTINGGLHGGTGAKSGSIESVTGNLGPIVIRGSVIGGSGQASGTIKSAHKIAGITIGGSISTGGNAGSGHVLALGNIGPILVKGSLAGTAAAPVVICAGALSTPVGTSAVAIKSLTVLGHVEHSRILAGYNGGTAVNGDAQIGAVVVAGDWIASNLVAGSSAGADLKFGTPDDLLINNPQNDAAITASIGSIVIKGQVLGTPLASDSFGFVAQRIGSVTVGGSPVTLTPGASKDYVVLGPFADLRINEV